MCVWAGVCEHNFDDADLRLQTAGPTNGDVYESTRARAHAQTHADPHIDSHSQPQTDPRTH